MSTSRFNILLGMSFALVLVSCSSSEGGSTDAADASLSESNRLATDTGAASENDAGQAGQTDLDAEDGSLDASQSSSPPPQDEDEDGIADDVDNCPLLSNGEQDDLDGDGEGDICDLDDDGDGVMDEADNCSFVSNVGQADNDEDGAGDACDPDDDNDGVMDELDNCPEVSNSGQENSDGTGAGDACDIDDDKDGVMDGSDNCPNDANLDQADSDGDGIGDVCDDDGDGDGIADDWDNCPEVPNPKQLDADNDDVGDKCDESAGLWLLSIDNTTHELLKVDAETSVAVPLCTLDTEDSYPSLTFNREGLLYAANSAEDRLDLINPCDCTIEPVGVFGYNSFIVGITTNHSVDLFGVDKFEDWLVEIETDTGLATPIGTEDMWLGINLGPSGGTWSDAKQVVYAINGMDSTLHTVDPQTGLATFVADLSIAFSYVGIELHPANEVIYACTGPNLYSIDAVTGVTTLIGEISPNECNNLAAPYKNVTCPQWVEP